MCISSEKENMPFLWEYVTTIMSWGCIISGVTGYRPGDEDSVPGRSRDFFFTTSLCPFLGPTEPLVL
jgi:hypothetical protein